MAELPTGTVTFLFTDVEGSTRLWEEHPETMKTAMARHDRILRDAVEANGGHVVKMTGDGVHAAFASAPDAVEAGLAAQRGLRTESWPETRKLKVRMGLHSGEAEFRDGDYFGSAPNRAARLMAVGHGGQLLVSHATEELARDGLTEDVILRDLGDHRLRDLSRVERVFQVVAAGVEESFPPLRSLDAYPGNLPIQATSFVGRDRELAATLEALEQGRVVTLTGVGGVGKTRLALQAAAAAAPAHRDGCWFCELAPVGIADALVEAMATTLSVPQQLGRSIEDSLVDFMRGKKMLIVLDNCEHLLDPVARLVDLITQRCGGVAVLATSREGLGILGERMIALRSLSLPEAGAAPDVVAESDAVRLFLDRAADVKARFSLTVENSDAVVQICRRLDGIPLAIELAAARVQAMTPHEIAARLDDQFRLLGAAHRTAIERHQTLRRAIDWSYELLEDDERSVLERLAVFAGGCTLDAAEHVLSGNGIASVDVVDRVVGLVRRSLVVADDEAEQTRYRLLETIRQYAQERLEESGLAEVTRRRHAEYYSRLAEDAGPRLRGSDQVDTIARLVPEIDNLRAAVSWASTHGALDLATRIVLPLCVNCISISLTVLDWAAEVAANPPVDRDADGPAVVAWAAWRALMGADHGEARRLVERALEAQERLDVPPGPAVLQAQATLALFTDNAPEAVGHARRWVQLGRERNDPYETVQGLTMLASAMGDPRVGGRDEAIAVFEEAAAEARKLGNPSSLSMALASLAIPLGVEDADRSVPLLQEAIEVGTSVGNDLGVGMALSMLGWVQADLDDHRAALVTYLGANERILAAGYSSGFVSHCTAIARSIVSFGSHEAGAIIQGAADARADVLPEQGELGEARLATITAMREVLGEHRLAELMAEGARMTDEEVVAYCRVEIQRQLEQTGQVSIPVVRGA